MGHRRKCQTYTASPAEPGGLPVMLATRIFHSFYLAKERTLSTLLPIPTSSMKAFQATGD
jgi:hypothetical protein